MNREGNKKKLRNAFHTTVSSNRKNDVFHNTCRRSNTKEYIFGVLDLKQTLSGQVWLVYSEPCALAHQSRLARILPLCYSMSSVILIFSFIISFRSVGISPVFLINLLLSIARI